MVQPVVKYIHLCTVRLLQRYSSSSTVVASPDLYRTEHVNLHLRFGFGGEGMLRYITCMYCILGGFLIIILQVGPTARGVGR